MLANPCPSLFRRLPVALVLLLVPLAAGCGDDTAPGASHAPTARIMVFSDPHYFASSLGSTGAAFQDYLAQDRKLIAESDALMRTMVGLVETEDPDIVLVSGDLTKDGERLSHDTVASFFLDIESRGRKVFVVPGNHDTQNGGAKSYAGDVATDVPTISAAEFASIYQDAGYEEALARDPGSLSYIAELLPGLWLLAIDSCIYGDTRGSSMTGGRLSEDTRAWIKLQLDEAKRHGARVLAMMHHGLVEHFANQTLLFADFVIADRVAVASLLSEGGVHAVFTGHFHANDITQVVAPGQQAPIFDIETGSTVTYPCPYRIVDVSSDVLSIATRHVSDIPYDLGGAPDFQSYAHDSLRVGLETLIAGLIQAPPYSISADEAATLSPWLGDGLVAHYAGDEIMPADVPIVVQDLLSSGNLVEGLAGTMLQSIYTDLPPPDNDVTLDLSIGM